MLKLENGRHIRINFIPEGCTDVEHLFIDNGSVITLNTKTLKYYKGLEAQYNALTGNFNYFADEVGQGNYIKHNDYLYMMREEPNFYN